MGLRQILFGVSWRLWSLSAWPSMEASSGSGTGWGERRACLESITVFASRIADGRTTFPNRRDVRCRGAEYQPSPQGAV